MEEEIELIIEAIRGTKKRLYTDLYYSKGKETELSIFLRKNIKLLKSIHDALRLHCPEL